MPTKDQVLKELALFNLGSGGLGSWITEESDDVIFERLSEIETNPISKVQLNQLLAFGHEAPLSEGFFRYVWLTSGARHPYDTTTLPDFEEAYIGKNVITSLAHLKWGLYRIFTDGLLFFGNVRSAYRELRSLKFAELHEFFAAKAFNAEVIKGRGPALPLQSIPKDDRYLIAEMACKSYGEPGSSGDLKDALVSAFRQHQIKSSGSVKIKTLLSGSLPTKHTDRQKEFEFSADEVLEEAVSSEDQLMAKYQTVADKFLRAREAALKNTRLYLSMVGDLDVYVATSMRTRQDFREMATFCDKIFMDERLREMKVRYFDPTLSAAAGHEDKGLIECLMVRCAKVLVYYAGERETYGKDAEAAMALSLGKPVIFFCDQAQRHRFYRDVHPLSRLIEFRSGIAVGAMVTDKVEDVSELLWRLFENKMEYRLESKQKGHLRLLEARTQSVVRLQTSDRLLSETFWNYYHSNPGAV